MKKFLFNIVHVPCNCLLQYIHSWSARRISESGISTLLKTEEKSCITRCFATAFYVILIFQLCYNFNTFLITLYILGMTLRCINILPCIFDKPYSTLYASSTLLAPWIRLPFSADTFRNSRANREICWEQTCGYETISTAVAPNDTVFRIRVR
jgi:hypothetical protein